MAKQLIIAAVLGILFGLGVASVIEYRERKTATIEPQEFSAACIDDSGPKVVLSWPPLVDNAVPSGLERSKDDGTWVLLLEGRLPQFNEFTYVDGDVVLGSTYRYRITVDGKDITPILTVPVTTANCTRTVTQ